MDALRGIVGKGDSKSKENNKHSSSGPDTSSAYRSSDASEEPDVGTKSYSRDPGISRGHNDPDVSSSYSSRAGGGSGYSSGSSGSAAMGLGSEISFSGDSGRDNNPSYSEGGKYGSSSGTASSSDNYPSGSDVSSGRHHNPKEHSRRSGKDDNGDGGSYSSYSSGTTGANVGYDETGDMSSSAHGTRGMHGGRSSGGGMSGDNQSYASGDNNYYD